jgi:hypothetical protein
MECPKCGFIEQRDVQCPRCDALFNADVAEEWAHLDYLESRLGEWRERGVLPDEKVEELLRLVDAELAAVEEVLGVRSNADSAASTRPGPQSASAPEVDEDRVLDAVDRALARGDTREAERLLTSVDAPANIGLRSPPSPQSGQFDPKDSGTGLDLLFLVTADSSSDSQGGECFSRAIVYAAADEEAVQRVCAYIDLCNEASARQPDDGLEELHTPEAAAGNHEDDLPIGNQPDAIRATVLATTTTRLDDESVLDAEHLLVFETLRNE